LGAQIGEKKQPPETRGLRAKGFLWNFFSEKRRGCDQKGRRAEKTGWARDFGTKDSGKEHWKSADYASDENRSKDKPGFEKSLGPLKCLGAGGERNAKGQGHGDHIAGKKYGAI